MISINKSFPHLFSCIYVLIVVFMASIAFADDEYKGEVTEYGYYKQISELTREQNIATTSGYVRTGGEVQLEAQTTEIPLKLNRLFGFKFRIEGFQGKEAVQLKLVVEHPVITRPNGSTSKGYSYPVLLEVKNGVITNQSGYSIDHDYEMVEGDWTFEYWYNEHKLLSQSFKTVTPSNSQEGETQGATITSETDSGTDPETSDEVVPDQGESSPATPEQNKSTDSLLQDESSPDAGQDSKPTS